MQGRVLVIDKAVVGIGPFNRRMVRASQRQDPKSLCANLLVAAEHPSGCRGLQLPIMQHSRLMACRLKYRTLFKPPPAAVIDGFRSLLLSCLNVASSPSKVGKDRAANLSVTCTQLMQLQGRPMVALTLTCLPNLQAVPVAMFVQRGDDRARHFTNLDLGVRMVQQAFQLRTRCAWGLYAERAASLSCTSSLLPAHGTVSCSVKHAKQAAC